MDLKMMATTNDGQIFLRAMANAVCQYIPEGWEMCLCMKNGQAGIVLFDPNGNPEFLPDPADKSLEEQINDALLVANGSIA